MEVPKLDLVTQGVVRTQVLCIHMVSFLKLSPGRHFKASATWGEAILNILHLWFEQQHLLVDDKQKWILILPIIFGFGVVKISLENSEQYCCTCVLMFKLFYTSVHYLVFG